MQSAMELLAEHRMMAQLVDEHPAVTFLKKDHAAIIHTVLSATFSVERDEIDAQVFEAEVASVLGTLKADGIEVPARPVREVCRSWVDDHWLRLDPTPEGGQSYRRTYETSIVLRYLRDLSAPRQGTAAGNVPDFLRRVEDLASRLTGDKEHRAELLRGRIADLQNELDLLDEGVTNEATFDEFVSQHDQIVEMLSGIDLGFRHVTDELWRVQKRMFDEIALSGPDPIAQMQVGEDAWQELIRTPEGKAVDDALTTLLDAGSRAKLNRHIEQILTHDYAATLQPSERREFGDLAALLHSHVGPLVETNRRGNAELNLAFRKQAARGQGHQGFDELIRRARLALRDHPGRTVPQDALPRLSRLDLGAAPGQLPDLSAPMDAPTLAEIDESEALPPSADEIAKWSGPHFAQVTGHIDALLEQADGSLSIGQLWNAAPLHLRRSVELVAYFARAHALVDEARAFYPAGEFELIEAIGPDGRPVQLQIDTIRLRAADEALDQEESA